MKILELSPYVFVEDHPYAKKNRSGLAYMIRSICDMLATRNEVHIITQSIFTEKERVGNWLFVERNYWTILFHFRFKYFALAFRLRKINKQHGFARLLLYCLSGGQVESYIRKWKPDAVHIHGIGLYTIPFYYAASKMNVPILSTLHGLVSFNKIVPVSEQIRKLERCFLEMCVSNGYSMTFISSGMKKKVRELTKSDCSSITVIPNCFRVSNDVCSRVPHNPNTRKLICIGSIYPLKNQIQVIRILPALQQKYKDKCTISLDIYGDGVSLPECKEYCEKNSINNVFFHGRVPQKEIYNALNESDILVFPSIEEGFGIPIVEAYSCGIPVVTFRDLDASDDIASEDCVIFADDRSDDALFNAIGKAIERKWDSYKIKAFSNRFSIEETTEKYCAALSLNHKVWSDQSIDGLINDCLKNEQE